MDIIELSTEERTHLVKQEIKGFETQYLARVADASKYQDLLDAHDRGEFKDWDRSVIAGRTREWKQQRDSALIDAKSMEITLVNARQRLKALEEAAPEPLPFE